MASKTVEFPARMNCKACQYRVEKAVARQQGVLSIKTDLRSQRVTVEFDPSLSDETHLREAIDNSLNRGMLFE